MLYNVNPLCNSGQAGAPKAGIRIGDMKLLAYCYDVKGIDGKTSTGPRPAPKNDKAVDPAFKLGDGVVLYDLASDISESNNLAQDPAHAATVQQLAARLAELAEESVIPQQWTKPYQGPDYFCADCPLHPGGKGPGAPWAPWL